MLAVAVSLGQVLTDKGVTPEAIIHRPFITFPQTAELKTGMLGDHGINCKVTRQIYSVFLLQIFPLMNTTEIIKLVRMFKF